jgi:hypothetical protein
LGRPTTATIPVRDAGVDGTLAVYKG